MILVLHFINTVAHLIAETPTGMCDRICELLYLASPPGRLVEGLAPTRSSTAFSLFAVTGRS
jgi:hypothetical protein